MRKTSDFQSALRRGETDKAEDMYKTLKESGDLEKMPERTKEEAQAELRSMFDYGDTKGFRNDLAAGNVDNARNWLERIKANKLSFPQYLATWDSWLADRERELEEAGK